MGILRDSLNHVIFADLAYAEDTDTEDTFYFRFHNGVYEIEIMNNQLETISTHEFSDFYSADQKLTDLLHNRHYECKYYKTYIYRNYLNW